MPSVLTILTMKIESISAGPDRAGRYYVLFSDGSKLRLYRQTVEDFGLYTGKELEETEMKQLHSAAGAMSAKMRAVRIISASNVSKGDLQRRLVQKGETPGDAADAVKWMEDMDILDDRKTAESIVRSCAAKGYGMARAKQALYEKRIPKQYWQEALEDYPDQSDTILTFLQNRLDDSRDPRQQRRAVEALIRRGHSYSDIRRALQQLSMDMDDFREE